MSERRSPLEPPGTPRRHWRDSVTRLSLLGMVTFQVWVTVEERVVDAAGATGLVILALTGAAAFVVARRSAARDGVHPLPDTGWIVATLLICLMSGWIRGLETSLASRCYILAFSLLGAVLVPWWACRRRDLPAAVMGCLAIVSAGPFQLESLRSYALVAQLAWLAILVAPRSSAGGRQGRWIAVVFLPFLITIATSTVFSVFPYASSKALVQIVIGMGVAVAA
ncbi:hypothetical protein JW905_00985, partial [bacterium]|nr:hypothetical protein [candidate division CSSED10-310 bacterium]